MVTFKKNGGGFYDVGVNETTGWNYKNEDDGEDEPTGFSNGDAGTGDSQIVGEFFGHEKVLKQVSAGAGNEAWLYHDIGSDESYGVLEAWVYCAAGAGYAMLQATKIGGGNTQVWIYYGATNAIVYIYEGFPSTLVTNTAPKRWMHLSLEWNNSGVNKDLRGDGNLATGKVRLYVDGTQYGDYDMAVVGDVNRISLLGSSVNTVTAYWDAIAMTNTVDWNTDYSIGDNLNFETLTSISASNVLKFEITGEIFEIPTAVVILEESEQVGAGSLLQCTDTYSKDGASASNIIFEGVALSRMLTHPYELAVASRAFEIDRVTVTDSITADSDGIIDDIISNNCDYVVKGTLTDGADMGTITYAGDKYLRAIFRNLAFFEGWLWYLKAPVEQTSISLDFNAGTTDTGVTITQASNIWGFKAGRAGRIYTSVTVAGDTSSSGSAQSPWADRQTFGTNNYPHRDAALNTDALCDTTATNILDVLDNDAVLVEFFYQESSIGYLQPGQYFTLSYNLEGTDEVLQDTFIVNKIVYDALSGVGHVWASSYITYSYKLLNFVSQQLPQENSQLITENYNAISTNQTNISSINQLESDNYVCLKDIQAQNTGGGTFTSGAWRTRPLNTESHDTGSLCSLAANQFTLTAGTYVIRASAPAWYCDHHQTRLYNVTDSSLIISGTSEYNNNGSYAQSRSFLSGLFTIGASKALEFQHRCSTTKATNGMGFEANFGEEVYAIVELWKVG